MSPESGFVLNVDLSSYFDDLRKYSSVFVDSNRCKVVRDIEKHIKTLFNLEDDICLVNDKFLIPKFEDIRIVQHCPILRVRKCNFFDEQIHKNNNQKVSCEQTAVNLIQPEKTIDLSCRPKQRLKLGTSQERMCCNSTPKSNVFANDSKKRRNKNDSVESEIVNDNEEKVLSDQQKKKKHKHAYHSEDKANDIGIIDMSFSRIKKRSHDNCFVTSEDLSEDFDETLSTNTAEVIQKSNKRKKHRCYENGGKADTHSFKILDLNNKSTTLSEKHNKELECVNVSDCYNLVSEQLFTPTISEREHLSYNERKKKPRKAFEHKSDTNKTSENMYNSFQEEGGFCSQEESQNDCGNDKLCNKSVRSHRTDIEDLKQTCQEQIDFLLKQSQTNESSTFSKNNCRGSTDLDSFEHTENEQISQMSYGDKSLSDEHNVQSSVNKYTKPKRKRKHAKKKKRESQYLSAVGPVLNDIVLSKKVSQPSPSASEVAKHVFFTEEDFVEDMPIPQTPVPKMEKAKETVDTLESSELVLSQKCEAKHDKAPYNWQQELLKLANSSSKPIFHRNDHATAVTQAKVNSEAHLTPSDITSLNTNPDAKAINQTRSESLKFESAGADVLTTDKCGNETLETAVTKEGNDDYKDVTPDVDSIDPSNYPIIKKVVEGDIIIFKILKLSEKFEPEVSKTVLAKVIDSNKFPETITFDVIGGCDYKEVMKHNKSLIIELKWMDLIEPRLFYP